MVALISREMASEGRTKAINGRNTANISMPLRSGEVFHPAPRLAEKSVPRSSTVVARESHGADTNHTSHGQMNEEIATPIKAFLNSNITPRSGSRKARVDSASSTPSSTPNGTPTTARPTSIINASEKRFDRIQTSDKTGVGGLRAGKLDTAPNLMSDGDKAVSFSPREVLSQQASQDPMPTSPDNIPMFFRAGNLWSPASNAYNIQRSPVTTHPLTLSSVKNDNNATANEPYSDTTSPLEDSMPKFFYANGSPETEHLPTKSVSKPTSTVSSRHSAIQSAKPVQSRSHQERAASPLKDVELSRQISISKASPRAYLPLAHNGIVQCEPPHSEKSSPHHVSIGRRSSLKAGIISQPRHSKASSISSLDSRMNRRSGITLSDSQTPHLLPLTTQVVSTPQLLSENSAPNSRSRKSSTGSSQNSAVQSLPSLPREPQSPIRVIATDSRLEQLNKLAGNARRERKVLDLEISNSSLLAINRTLEREMRKQSAELRRYRRLPSAERISIAASAQSTASRLSSLAATEVSSGSDESSFDADLDPDLVSDEDTSSLVTSSLSTDSQTPRKAQQRCQDAKRFQLDLFKHQELLQDSQRMNQSLKRCLGWTDDLISEGKKALAYRAKTSETDVEGQALTPDEADVELMKGTDLVSPSHRGTMNPWDTIDQAPVEGTREGHYSQMAY